MFAVIFAFGVVANAQINYGAEVDVPFEFSIGEKVYEAGKYTVKINKGMIAGAVLTIQKSGSNQVQSVLMNNNGGERSSDVQLVFSSVRGTQVSDECHRLDQRFFVAQESGPKRPVCQGGKD